MDINNNMELENYELVIGNVSEGINSKIDSSMIAEEMVKKSIDKQIANNRKLNNSVEQAVYEMVKNDLLPYINENVRGK